MSIRVYDFEAKTRALMSSGILPNVTTVTAFCEAVGIKNRTYYHTMVGKERPSRTKENHTIVDISNTILDGITRAYGIPESYFTKPYSVKEFVRLLDSGPWKVLCELQQSREHCDLSASGSDLEDENATELNSSRFGPVGNKQKPEPALGYFKVRSPIIFELSGWQNWNVILLNRRPDNRIICLLPNSDQPTVKIPKDGVLHLPECGHWEVQPQDPPGTHQFMAIFHEKDWLQKEIDLPWFYKQLSMESDVDQQRSVLSKLVDWLEIQDSVKPRPFEVVVKDLEVLGL